jgi:hypothetical protein
MSGRLRRRLNRVQGLRRAIFRPNRVQPRLAVGFLLDLPLRIGEETMGVVQGVGHDLAAVGLFGRRDRLTCVTHLLDGRCRTGSDCYASEQQ